MAQERVITKALAAAGLSPSDVDAVEAHGTGTRLGDPIEAGALLATYGRRESDRPLWLGSLKSNIGHAQAAAGVGGVIKMVMALRHGVLPRTLHAEQQTSYVDWSAGSVKLLQEPVPWPREDGRVRRAGVSSFGISGTNAHVILAEPPAEETAPAGSAPILLSAHDQAALSRQATSLADFLVAHPDTDPADVAQTLLTRARLDHGAAIFGDAVPGLRALAAGEPTDQVITGERVTGRTVFVFPGQGSQWPEMARALLESAPVFRAEIEACDAAFAEYVDWSLLALLTGDPDAPGLDRVDVVQPALFAVMVSLAALWRSAGVEPDAVVGHSQGEIAAAYVCGALSLADAARVVLLRSKALTRITGGAGMMSVALPLAEVEPVLSRWDGAIEVAAHNGPRSTVVAGADTALDELLAWCEERDVRARRVPVDYASHTRCVEALREHLVETFHGLRTQPARIAFYSSVEASAIDTEALDGTYWYRNLRQPVRFAETVDALVDAGFHRFVEVSPHPVLTYGIDDVLAGRGVTVGTLRRDEGDLAAFHRALAAAHVSGAPVTWDATPAVRVDLPTYPFDRQTFWLTTTAATNANRLGLATSGHPLAGAVVELAGENGRVLTAHLDTGSTRWLADHSVFGTTLLPGTAFAELAAYAAGEDGLGDLTLRAPLVLDRPVQLQVRLEDHRITIHSRPANSTDPWLLHAEGTVGSLATPEPFTVTGDPVDLARVYQDLYERGYDYGPAFQGLTAAWRDGDVVHAEITTDLDDGFTVHPALLDGALHPVVAGLTPIPPGEPDRPLLPFAFEGVRFTARATGTLRVRIRPIGDARVRLDFADADGTPVGVVESLAFRPVDVRDLTATRPVTVHHVEWVPATATTEPTVAVEDLDVAIAGDQPVDVVLHVSGAPDVHVTTVAVLAVLQRVLAVDHVRLVVATRNAVAAVAGDGVDDLAAAAVWGLVRVAAAENPGRFRLVDTDVDTAAEVLAGFAEPEVAIRAGQVLVPRLVATPIQPAEVRERTGTVLITGGTGALGALVARHLAAKPNPPHLLLASRSGRAAPAAPTWPTSWEPRSSRWTWPIGTRWRGCSGASPPTGR
ncbi:hypothetical protein GCM10029964_052260 [Kibdelosporangium lantanae]